MPPALPRGLQLLIGIAHSASTPPGTTSNYRGGSGALTDLIANTVLKPLNVGRLGSDLPRRHSV